MCSGFDSLSLVKQGVAGAGEETSESPGAFVGCEHPNPGQVIPSRAPLSPKLVFLIQYRHRFSYISTLHGPFQVTHCA